MHSKSTSAATSNPLGTRRQAALALLGFFRIMMIWGVDDSRARSILGRPAPRTFFNWKRGIVGAVPPGTLERIGYVSAIWKALQVLYSDPAQADRWPAVPNRAFGGKRPLDRMAAGGVSDLAAVRQYLEHARAPWS